jgi:hypothetical protein
MVHGLSSYEGVTFYEVAEVKDPEEDKWYVFDLKGEGLEGEGVDLTGEGSDLKMAQVAFETKGGGLTWFQEVRVRSGSPLTNIYQEGIARTIRWRTRLCLTEVSRTPVLSPE